MHNLSELTLPQVSPRSQILKIESIQPKDLKEVSNQDMLNLVKPSVKTKRLKNGQVIKLKVKKDDISIEQRQEIDRLFVANSQGSDTNSQLADNNINYADAANA